MADVFTKKKRSQVMASIRSKGNKATELKLASILRAARITGWRRHQPLPGHPDFIFRRQRLAVFVDGCFWHGCRWHCRMPQANRQYWQRKIASNSARDRRTTRLLRSRGWRVLRIWGHALTSPETVAARITSQLSAAPEDATVLIRLIPKSVATAPNCRGEKLALGTKRISMDATIPPRKDETTRQDRR